MKCKFCGSELDRNVEICPECGLEVEPDQMGKKRSGWKIALAIVAGLILLAGLAAAVMYGMGILPVEQKENNVSYKDSYTVDDKTAQQKENVVIATAGDKKLDNGMFQFYYALEVMDFLNNNSYYLSYYGLDYTQPLDQQYVADGEDITWQQMFIDSAINDWYSYALMNMMAEQAGYTISEEMQNNIDTLAQQLEDLATSNSFASAQEMIETDFGAGYNAENYIRYLTERYTAVDYVSYLYETLAPTQEELETYFTENEDTLAESGITKDAGYYGSVRHILIQPENGTTDEEGYTTYSEEDWAACQAEAQAILDEWLNGDATEDTFAALANLYSEDTGSNTNGGLYTEVTEGQMVDEFDYWLFYGEHEYGDYGLIRTTYGYHLMFFVGLDEIWSVETENLIISEKIEQIALDAEALWPIEKEYKKIVLSELSL